MSPDEQQTAAQVQEATIQEQEALNQAIQSHLQSRVVMLAVQVQQRDARIAQLEQELTTHLFTEPTPEVTDSGEPDAQVPGS